MTSEQIETKPRRFSPGSNDIDTCEPTIHAQDFLQDGRGFTYRLVRTCDMERFSIK